MTTEAESALLTVVRDLRNVVDQLRFDLVRKDVYSAEREADRAEVAGLREDVLDIKSTLSKLIWAIVTSLTFPLTAAVILYFALR